jgi:hypothetical protein
VAESVRRKTDRIHSARVSEPRHRPRRAPSATSANRVSHLLPSRANTSGLGEGRPDATARSDADGRARGRVPGSGRTPSSVRTTRRGRAPVGRRLGVDAVYVCAERPFCAARVCSRPTGSSRHHAGRFAAASRDGRRARSR